MSDISNEPADALWSRLRVIEGQALSERAAAYSAVHDELARRLESAPKAPGPSLSLGGV